MGFNYKNVKCNAHLVNNQIKKQWIKEVLKKKKIFNFLHTNDFSIEHTLICMFVYECVCWLYGEKSFNKNVCTMFIQFQSERKHFNIIAYKSVEFQVLYVTTANGESDF